MLPHISTGTCALSQRMVGIRPVCASCFESELVQGQWEQWLDPNLFYLRYFGKWELAGLWSEFTWASCVVVRRCGCGWSWRFIRVHDHHHLQLVFLIRMDKLIQVSWLHDACSTTAIVWCGSYRSTHKLGFSKVSLFVYCDLEYCLGR